MDEMTQQNAAMVFQATNSIESMKDQSTELSDLIGFFHSAKSVQTQRPVERRTDTRPWSPVNQSAQELTTSSEQHAAAVLGTGTEES